MEIKFLGTGAGVPSKERNVSAIALNLTEEINHIWLFDCGEATQHQILHTNLKPRKINKIFITHLHGDHIYGLPGLLSSRSFLNGDDLLTVYGPPGIKDYIKTSLNISGTHLTYPLDIIEFTEGVIFEDNTFKVSTFLLDHGVPSFGFRIEEADKIGELNVEKLKAEGIKPGPIYKTIKSQTSTLLEDGRIIKRDDYIGKSKKGRIICIFGDTRFNDNFIQHALNADLLIHEATFEETRADLAYDYFHSTTKQAATLAKKASVKQLILTHISSKYQNGAINELLTEARSTFEQTLIAHDFFSYTIKQE